MGKILTLEAQADSDDFDRLRYEFGGCSCCVSTPCGYCTHPGNPLNQEEDDMAWIEEGIDFDALEKKARKSVDQCIEDAAGRHLTEMRIMMTVYNVVRGIPCSAVSSAAAR